MNKILLVFLSCFLIGCGSHAYKPSKNALKGADHIADIKAATKNIDDIGAGTSLEDSLKGETKVINESAGKIDKIVDAQDRELQKARDSYYQMYQRWLSAIVILSFLTVAVSIALILMGHLKSVTMTVIAASIFGGALALQLLTAYAIYIAIAFVLFVGGFIIYAVMVKNKTVSQLVRSVEVGIKTNVIPLDQFAPIANDIQDPVTKKQVDQEQAKLNR